MNAPSVTARGASAANAWFVLACAVLTFAGIVALASVALRHLDEGTDTRVYAAWYQSLRGGATASRFEPLFVLVSRIASGMGMGVAAWQGAMFALLLGVAAAASAAYSRSLGTSPRSLLVPSAALLLLSPVFVNAAINATRQGLAAFPVIAALIAFHRGRWVAFVAWALVATGFHYSALLYIALAPVLLLSPRWLRVGAALGFLAYASGFTMIVVRAIAPSAYSAVMAYGPDAVYRAGVRLDFAVFSIFWYFLPMVLVRSVREPWAQRIVDMQGVYLVLLAPFLLVGWGNYSNRYLLPAWLYASLVLAALLFFSRLSPLRHPVLLGACLAVGCAAFAFYVGHGITL